MGMVTQTRKYVAIASFALSFASFCTFVGADLWYASTRPTQSDAEIGRIYAHKEKNSPTVYLTAPEATGLSLLPFAMVVGLVVFLMAPTTERNYLGETKRFIPTKKEYGVLGIAILTYVLIFAFLGPPLTGFAVSHGIILTWAI
jgi:hypothetical protein